MHLISDLSRRISGRVSLHLRPFWLHIAHCAFALQLHAAAPQCSLVSKRRDRAAALPRRGREHQGWQRARLSLSAHAQIGVAVVTRACGCASGPTAPQMYRKIATVGAHRGNVLAHATRNRRLSPLGNLRRTSQRHAPCSMQPPFHTTPPNACDRKPKDGVARHDDDAAWHSACSVPRRMQRATTAACPAAPRFVQPRDGPTTSRAARDLPRGAPQEDGARRGAPVRRGGLRRSGQDCGRTPIRRTHAALMAQRTRGMHRA